MAAATEPLLMTVEQYRQLPDREDVIQELHWGMVVTLSRPKMSHAKLQSRLVRLLRPKAEHLGVVESEVAFKHKFRNPRKSCPLPFERSTGVLGSGPETRDRQHHKSRWRPNGLSYGRPHSAFDVPQPSGCIRDFRYLRERHGSKRNDRDRVLPVFWRIVRPDQDERFDYRPERSILGDHQQDAWAVVPFVQKRCKVTWHRTLVVADQNPTFGGSAAQYSHVVKAHRVGRFART